MYNYNVKNTIPCDKVFFKYVCVCIEFHKCKTIVIWDNVSINCMDVHSETARTRDYLSRHFFF